MTEQREGWAPDDTFEDDGVLAVGDSLDSDDVRADPLDTGIDAGTRYHGATAYGTTWDEERRGESLDQLLAEEEPDLTVDDEPWTDEDVPPSDDQPTQLRSGRLVAPDQGAHGDAERDEVASAVGIDGGGASAEEAAVHLTEPPDYT